MYPCETMSFGYKQDSYLSRKKKASRRRKRRLVVEPFSLALNHTQVPLVVQML